MGVRSDKENGAGERKHCAEDFLREAVFFF